HRRTIHRGVPDCWPCLSFAREITWRCWGIVFIWGPTMTTTVTDARGSVGSTRWVQLVLGLIAMMSISSPQYVWTLFTKPLQDALGVNLPAIQVTFTIVIVLQTFFSPVQGYLVDRFGPRLLIAIGCLLSGLGWITSAYATSLTGLYMTYGFLCGIGTG